jgi:hypothetical protein
MRANTRLQYFQHFGYKAESVPPPRWRLDTSVLARPWAFEIEALVCRVIVKTDSYLCTGNIRTLRIRICKVCHAGNACNTFEPLEGLHCQLESRRPTIRPSLVAVLTDRISNGDTIQVPEYLAQWSISMLLYDMRASTCWKSNPRE